MRSYKPWRQNLITAFISISLALSSGVLAIQHQLPWNIAVAVMITCTLVAILQFKRASRRQFGKTFENTHVAMAMKHLRNTPFKGVPNAKGGGQEDIDLLVVGRGRPIPVEVKSYIHWQTYFWRLFGARERRAIAQSKRQQRYTNARASIIWLPQGRPGFWQRLTAHPKAASNIHLVFGGTDELIRAIEHAKHTYGQ